MDYMFGLDIFYDINPTQPAASVQPTQPIQPTSGMASSESTVHDNHDDSGVQTQVSDASDASLVIPAKQRMVIIGAMTLTIDQAKVSALLAGMIGQDEPDEPDLDDSTAEPIVLDSLPDKVKESYALALYFDGLSACEIFHLYGLLALDDLLAAANYLVMKACVEQIIDVCKDIADSKAMQTQFKSSVVEAIYHLLVSQAGLPPMGLGAPRVAQMCWLCYAMSTIMQRSLERQFVKKLFGYVDQLVVCDNQMFINNTDSWSCQVATNAIVGTDHYHTAMCNQTCHLFMSNIVQIGQHLAWLSQTEHPAVQPGPAEPTGPAESAGPTTPNGLVVLASLVCTSVDIDVSPCQKYILWRVDLPVQPNQPDQDRPNQQMLGQTIGRCNMVFCLATHQAVCLPSNVQRASRAWWLGDQLAFSVPGTAVFQTHQIDQINQIDQIDKPVTYIGSFAATSGTHCVSTYVVGQHTMVQVWRGNKPVDAVFETQTRVVCADRRDKTGGTFVMSADDDMYQLLTMQGSPDTWRPVGAWISTHEVRQIRCKVVWQADMQVPSVD